MLARKISIRKRGKKGTGETTERAVNNFGSLQYLKPDITKLKVRALCILRKLWKHQMLQ